MTTAEPNSTVLSPAVQAYVAEREAEFDEISAERKEVLESLAGFVKGRSDAGQSIRLTFICTHNSRRSHLGQIWAAIAAARYGIDGVETFSGGTESTAFNPRAVAALQRAGVEITEATPGENPRYRVEFAEGRQPLLCFSKVYDEAPNPAKDFAAVMTCSDADEACPMVPGATARFAIRYEDPKVADGTSEESAKYDERSTQIAREMLYAFSRAAE